ncbi:hypothetical protein C8Q76DRAFT_89035 [Earliella scabrosa]|nr:hypothetical protein C8Q76DRAFT_89035 [Earliella scabrosa]
MRPALPLEVEERIIDHLQSHVRSLLSCCVVCKAWIPRARFHLFRRIYVTRKEELADLCSFLDSNPTLRGVIHGVTLSLAMVESPQLDLYQVAPLILLSQLPELRRWELVNPDHHDHSSSDDPIHFKTIARYGFGAYGCLRELRLVSVRFFHCTELARFLLAIPSLVELECEDVKLDQLGSEDGLALLTSRLRGQTQISRLSLLLEVTCFTLEHLQLELGEMPSSSSGQEDVARALTNTHFLQCLSFHLRYSPLMDHLRQFLGFVTYVLSTASLPKLQELNLHVGYGDCHYKSDAELEDCYHELSGLERHMLQLQGPRLVWTTIGQRADTLASRRKLLSRLLPTLYSQNLLFEHCPGEQPVLEQRTAIVAVAISPDRELIGTASRDGIINIRDAYSDELLRGWECKKYVIGHAERLIFSPDGCLIASFGTQHHPAIWSIDNPARYVMLRGHKKKITAFAWSPSMPTICASASADGTVRIWDTVTCKTLHRLSCTSDKDISVCDLAVFSLRTGPCSTRVDQPAGGTSGTLRRGAIALEDLFRVGASHSTSRSP